MRLLFGTTEPFLYRKAVPGLLIDIQVINQDPEIFCGLTVLVVIPSSRIEPDHIIL